MWRDSRGLILPNAGGKAWGGFAVALAGGSCVDFAFGRGGYAAGRGVAGLFCIILVIADSVASWDGFCGAAPITRIM